MDYTLRGKPANTYTVGPSGCGFTSMQAAIDSAYNEGASWENLWSVQYNPLLVADDAKRNRNGKLLTSTGELAAGVILEPTTQVTDNEERPVFDKPVVTLAFADGNSNYYMAGMSVNPGTSAATWTHATGYEAGYGIYRNITALAAGTEVCHCTLDYDNTGVGGHSPSIDITDATHIGLWIKAYGTVGAIAAGQLELGVSAATDLSNAVYCDMPAIANASDVYYVPLSSAQKALGAIQSIGIRIKTQASGDTSIGVADVRVHYLDGYSPVGYAASKGIVMMTSAIAERGDAAQYPYNLTWAQLRDCFMRYGSEIGCESMTHANGFADGELDNARMLKETVEAKEVIENSTVPGALPPESGIVVTSWLQPGTFNGEGYIDTLVKSHNFMAQAIKRFFKCSTAYLNYASVNQPHFGANQTYMQSTYIKPFNLVNPPAGDNYSNTEGMLPVNNGIGYTNFKQLIDQLVTWRDAGLCYVVSFTTGIISGRTKQAQTLPALAKQGDMADVSQGNDRYWYVSDGSVTQLATGGVDNGYALKIGDDAATNAATKFYDLKDQVKAGRRYWSSLAVKSSVSSQPILNISIRHSYINDAGVSVDAPDLLIYPLPGIDKGVVPASTDSFKTVHFCYGIPAWATRSMLVIKKKSDIEGGIIIDNLKKMEV